MPIEPNYLFCEIVQNEPNFSANWTKNRYAKNYSPIICAICCCCCGVGRTASWAQASRSLILALLSSKGLATRDSFSFLRFYEFSVFRFCSFAVFRVFSFSVFRFYSFSVFRVFALNASFLITKHTNIHTHPGISAPGPVSMLRTGLPHICSGRSPAT